jgi:hypothetical protein
MCCSVAKLGDKIEKYLFKFLKRKNWKSDGNGFEKTLRTFYISKIIKQKINREKMMGEKNGGGLSPAQRAAGPLA